MTQTVVPTDPLVLTIGYLVAAQAALDNAREISQGVPNHGPLFCELNDARAIVRQSLERLVRELSAELELEDPDPELELEPGRVLEIRR